MQYIDIQKTEHFIYIKLSRPEKRNAFHPDMINELTKAFVESDLDEDARAIVLSGEGKSFCAGADLGWMQSMANFTKAENIADSEKLFELFEAATRCELPIVTKAHGHVMGGALGLLAISDIVIAEEKTKFSFSEVKLGLAPAVISPFVMRKMDYQKAHQFMLTGEVFCAKEALYSGLVNKVVDESSLESALSQVLGEFLKNGPKAMRATKALLNHQFLQQITPLKKITTECIAERRVSPEGQQGLKGFLNQEPISWKRDGDI